jgi:hypothetical protein
MRWPDIEAVHAIEAAVFDVDPWSAEPFWGELAQPTRSYVVAEDDGIECEQCLGVTQRIACAIDEFSAETRSMTIEDRLRDHRIVDVVTHEFGH